MSPEETNEGKIGAAQEQDLPLIRSLLSDFSLPTVGLEDAQLWVMEAPKKSDLIGCIGLELYGNQGLLRSLAVKKHYQGNGVGLRLIEKVLEEAKLNRVLELYLLTEGAEHYFKKKFGFVSFSPQEKFSFQGPVTQSKEFQEACPESAILMKMIVNSSFER